MVYSKLLKLRGIIFGVFYDFCLFTFKVCVFATYSHKIYYLHYALKNINLGRYKSVEIKGLFFENFEETFEKSFIAVIKESKLSEKEIIEKLSPKFKDYISDYENTISSFYLENHKFNINSFLKTHFNNQRAIAITHKNSFIPFFLYINGCAIAYEKAIMQISRKRIDSTLKMNVALYGLVVRRAEEIGDLLLNGYIDGAMIVWRSLYENSVILLLLALENDPVLADKFYNHSIKNAQRKIESYNKHCKDLKFKPLPKSTHKNLRIKTDSITKKYGKNFIDNGFGWADDLFPGKQKANFRLIEERVKLSRYRPYYLWCCEQIHSNFNGFKNFMEGNRIMLPRLLEKDMELEAFIDPMQFTISILHEINDYFLYEFSTKNEYEVNLLLMRKIFEQQQTSFN